jgi:hypothetical protein
MKLGHEHRDGSLTLPGDIEDVRNSAPKRPATPRSPLRPSGRGSMKLSSRPSAFSRRYVTPFMHMQVQSLTSLYSCARSAALRTSRRRLRLRKRRIGSLRRCSSSSFVFCISSRSCMAPFTPSTRLHTSLTPLTGESTHTTSHFHV